MTGERGTDRAQVLITPEELALDAPSGGRRLILDTTVLLAPARHDGDYRAESGLAAWREAHLPGSRHVDLLTRFTDPAAPFHFADPGPEAVHRELALLGVDPGTELIVYDSGSTQWATRLWWTLRNAGVAARVLDGGLARWQRSGLPVERGSAAVPPRPAGPRPADAWPAGGRGLWADLRLVRDISLGRRPGTLVCALGREHFDGTAPTRYTRRGRIPGSVSLPARAVLTDSGEVAGPARLDAYAAGLPADAPGPVVVYCGGGISATLAALGLVLAGVRDVRVYDGSLEEWTADRTLPVLTGREG
ncbi:rhodanese-like domain-containing protein [Streptomyces sp. NPDC020996]|uniref:sulfurtransferase n=1 Tax=Streptomyces sp. NPDC020996 TaxID=3154791 RepID=UPI0033EDB149